MPARAAPVARASGSATAGRRRTARASPRSRAPRLARPGRCRAPRLRCADTPGARRPSALAAVAANSGTGAVCASCSGASARWCNGAETASPWPTLADPGAASSAGPGPGGTAIRARSRAPSATPRCRNARGPPARRWQSWSPAPPLAGARSRAPRALPGPASRPTPPPRITVFTASTALARDHGDLHRVLREREPGLHAGARRRLARRHPGVPDAVHLAEGSDIREPDVGPPDALFAAPGLAQQLIDLAQNLRRLPRHIGAGIVGHLTGDENQAVADHGGAHAGVGPNALDVHRKTPSRDENRGDA